MIAMAAARDGVNRESSHSSIRMTMVRVSIVATASLAFMVSMAVAPPAAVAERFRDGPGGRVVATPRPFTTPLAPRPFVTPRPFAQTLLRPPPPRPARRRPHRRREREFRTPRHRRATASSIGGSIRQAWSTGRIVWTRCQDSTARSPLTALPRSINLGALSSASERHRATGGDDAIQSCAFDHRLPHGGDRDAAPDERPRAAAGEHDRREAAGVPGASRPSTNGPLPGAPRAPRPLDRGDDRARHARRAVRALLHLPRRLLRVVW